MILSFLCSWASNSFYRHRTNSSLTVTFKTWNDVDPNHSLWLHLLLLSPPLMIFEPWWSPGAFLDTQMFLPVLDITLLSPKYLHDLFPYFLYVFAQVLPPLLLCLLTYPDLAFFITFLVTILYLFNYILPYNVMLYLPCSLLYFRN